jgi:endonuclease/exonuclease/phosphatase family metal-dependent hydrolase
MRRSSAKLRWVLRIVAVVLGLPLAWFAATRVASPWTAVRLRQAQAHAPRDVPLTGELRVACYNIAHGRGLAPTNWAREARRTRPSRLEAIAALLVEIDADVVVLNEVDFACAWSGHENPSARLLDRRVVDTQLSDHRPVVSTLRLLAAP